MNYVSWQFIYLSLFSWQFICWGPNCSTSEYDFIYREGLHRGNQVKNKVLRIDLNLIWLLSLWKGEIWMKTCRSGGMPYKYEDSHLRAKLRGLEQILPSRCSKVVSTLILDFRPPELWDNTFLLRISNLWYFVMMTLGNEYSRYLLKCWECN